MSDDERLYSENDYKRIYQWLGQQAHHMRSMVEVSERVPSQRLYGEGGEMAVRHCRRLTDLALAEAKRELERLNQARSPFFKSPIGWLIDSLAASEPNRRMVIKASQLEALGQGLSQLWDKGQERLEACLDESRYEDADDHAAEYFRAYRNVVGDYASQIRGLRQSKGGGRKDDLDDSSMTDYYRGSSDSWDDFG